MSTYTQRKQEAKDRIYQYKLQIEEIQEEILRAQQDFEEKILTRSQQRSAKRIINTLQKDFHRLQVEQLQAIENLTRSRVENRELRLRRRAQNAVQQAHPNSTLISSDEEE